ncbi:uncharacterized protein LOC124277936 [Haliotis rubra]|uniref:uncharacterized protein LOC124277936 n=1 Tax=Haliotis rubra TaxID=36100 RepID=UPI001EE56ECC|nr:uncharacterized protein LOC124277936 [Haliotis rubra]
MFGGLADGLADEVMEPQATPRRDIKREILDMTPSSYISTDQNMLAGPESEMREPDNIPEGGLKSEIRDLTLSGVFSTPRKRAAAEAAEIVAPDITLRCRNFTVTTVSSSISPVRKTFTAPADGVVQSPETPKGELKKEMTDMTASIFISPATKEAAKSVTEVMETQGTSRDDLRNEKVDMMPSIYILNAQKKAAETMDLSETSSRTDKEEDEIHLPVGHKGRNLLQCTLNSLNGQRRKDMSNINKPPAGGEEADKDCTVSITVDRSIGKLQKHGERRPRGRPRKHDSLKAVAPRPRGRPRKHDSPKAVALRPIGRPHKHDFLKAVALRPLGRPRKHDSLEAVSPRPIGRPRKHDSLKAVAPRPIGRPRKHDTLKAVTLRPRGRPCKHDSCMALEVRHGRPCDHDSLLSLMAAAGRARSRHCEHGFLMAYDDEDHGSEDGHRDDILTEETSSNDDQFRASTVFSSPSIGRHSVEIPPTIVIVNMANGIIISESEIGNNGEALVADMILKPVRVDICQDEVKEYFHRKYVGTKHSKECYCLQK